MFLPVFVFIIIVMLSGSVEAESRFRESLVTLRFSTFIPPSHPAAKLFKNFARELETSSRGQVKVEYYGTSSLGKATEQYEIAVEGLADLATTCCAYAGSRFPLALVVELPLFADSAETEARIIMAMMKRGLFKSEFDDTVYLFPLATTPSRVFSNTVVTRVGDFRGIRIFGGGSVFVDVCAAVDAVPVFMGTPDVYMALQRHTVDAAIAPWTPGVAAWKWPEVVKYVIDIPILSGWHCNVVMNKKSWVAVPEAVRNAWQPLFSSYAIKFAKLYDRLDAVMKEKCQHVPGVEIVDFALDEQHRMAEMMIPVWQKWVDDNGSYGREIYKTYVEIMQKMGKRIWVKLSGLYRE